MTAEAKEIATEEPASAPKDLESPTEVPVTIDMANPANASALAEANVGDCVYLRITAKSDTEVSGNVENIEPMEEDGAENEDRAYRKKSGKDSDMPNGVMIVLGKRR